MTGEAENNGSLTTSERDSLAAEIHANLNGSAGPPEAEMQAEPVEVDAGQQATEGLDPDLEALQVQPGDSAEIVAEKAKLLKSYSRAMNKLHKGKYQEGNQENPENLEELRRHSELLKTILQNPDSAKALEAVKQLTPVQQPRSAFPKAQEFIPHLPKESAEFLNEEHRAPMVQLMFDVMQHALIPQLAPWGQALQQLLAERGSSQQQTILQKYPALKTEEGKQWLAKAQKYVNEKGLDMEEALFAASRGKHLAKTKASDERVNGNLSPRLPATSPKRTEPVTTRGQIDDDFRTQLADEIMEIDAKEGTNRYFTNRIRGRR